MFYCLLCTHNLLWIITKSGPKLKRTNHVICIQIDVQSSNFLPLAHRHGTIGIVYCTTLPSRDNWEVIIDNGQYLSNSTESGISSCTVQNSDFEMSLNCKLSSEKSYRKLVIYIFIHKKINNVRELPEGTEITELTRYVHLRTILLFCDTEYCKMCTFPSNISNLIDDELDNSVYPGSQKYFHIFIHVSTNFFHQHQIEYWHR